MARRRSRRGQYDWQIWRKLFKFTTLVAALGASGFYGYQVGQRLADEDLAAARGEIERLSVSESGHQETVARLQSELDVH